MNNYLNQYNGMPQTVNPYVNYVNSNSYFRPPAYEVVKVHGREGANAFQMGPNSSILLLDENDPIVWLAKTDVAGYKIVTPFRITPYEETPPVDISALSAKIKQLEADILALKEAQNGKPNFRGNSKRQQQPADNSNN